MLGIDPATWADFAAKDPKGAKKARQSAKAINFGVPGGLGAERLADYAKHTYGVDMTKDEAAKLRSKLVSVVYPELTLYLADDPFADLGRNLGVTRNDVWKAFNQRSRPEWFPAVVRKILAGRTSRKDETPYEPSFVSDVWDSISPLILKAPAVGDHWKDMVRLRQGDPKLADRLFRKRVVTLSGRIRTNVRYTEERNTPFQGSAADGAKIALHRLCCLGKRAVAFIHDEIVTEVPEARAAEETEIIKQVMRESMSLAIQSDLPIIVASEISREWSKP